MLEKRLQMTLQKFECQSHLAYSGFHVITLRLFYVRGQFTVSIIVLSCLRFEVVLLSMSIFFKYTEFLYYMYYACDPTFDPTELATCQLELVT